MSEDKPSIAELRRRLQFLDEGLEQHLQTRRLWIVTKPLNLFRQVWPMRTELVVARNASEARKLVRDKLYEIPGRCTPVELKAVELDMSTSRLLDVHDEEVRALMVMAQEEDRVTG